MRDRRIALRAGVAVLALFFGDLAANKLLLADGWFLGRPVAPFDPPLFSPSQFEALRRIEDQLQRGDDGAHRFDPELGWCNPARGGSGEYRYDWAGARIASGPLPHEKAPGIRRVLAIGCSMTHGEEVKAQDTWCALVDESLDGVEVANLGVAAYGIDQAFLRLRRSGPELHPDEVWLGILPQAALRVTTLYRPLLDHWSLDIAFKPAFRVREDGTLELLANPVATLADIPRLLTDQRAFLGALGGRDPWVSRAPLAYAPRGSHWTHRSFAARLLLTVSEVSGRHVQDCFRESTDAGRLYRAIVDGIAAESKAEGAAFRILILPGRDDLLELGPDRRGYWTDWVERCRRDGLSVMDVSSALFDSGVAFDDLFAPLGHYNATATRIVARAIVDQLAL